MSSLMRAGRQSTLLVNWPSSWVSRFDCCYSAISIARRLQDPLAELVKIDPKSIELVSTSMMSARKLSESLGLCQLIPWLTVGVNITTASPAKLLAHVAGPIRLFQKNVVSIGNRRLDSVSWGHQESATTAPKAFEQAAGFLQAPGKVITC